MSYPQGPRSQGPRIGGVGRRSLRLHDAPPGGLPPTPHHLRDSAAVRLEQEEEAERKAQREAREYTAFTRVAVVVGFLLIVAIAVLITIAVASH